MLVGLAMWGGVAMTSSADVIVTTGGGRFEGEVTQEGDTYVLTMANGGKMRFQKTAVREVIRSDAAKARTRADHPNPDQQTFRRGNLTFRVLAAQMKASHQVCNAATAMAVTVAAKPGLKLALVNLCVDNTGKEWGKFSHEVFVIKDETGRQVGATFLGLADGPLAGDGRSSTCDTKTESRQGKEIIRLRWRFGAEGNPLVDWELAPVEKHEETLVFAIPASVQQPHLEVKGIEPLVPLPIASVPPAEMPKPSPSSGTQGVVLLPPFAQLLDRGPREVRVRNPNDFAVSAGLRAGAKGRNFQIPANGAASVFVGDGEYDIYFVYSSRPDALFQGDSFSLRGNGVEIQIVKVVGGNYGIRQVK